MAISIKQIIGARMDRYVNRAAEIHASIRIFEEDGMNMLDVMFNDKNLSYYIKGTSKNSFSKFTKA